MKAPGLAGCFFICFCIYCNTRGQGRDICKGGMNVKRLIGLCVIVFCLVGCSHESSALDRAMQLRSQLMAQEYCSFEAHIVADYGDVIYSFTLDCVGNATGDIRFAVTEPESISGINGKLSQQSGQITFDDVALSFPMLAEGLVTPISGPWVLYAALRGGNITSAGVDGDYTRLTVHDSYAEDSVMLEIWLTNDNIPTQADIYWENRRILTMQIRNFQFL